MDANLYNQKAENIGKVNLPDEVFNLPENKDLVYQVVTSQISNQRQNIAHTKDRSEVRGGGKKPWRQKGTGRARHGSIRSPIWKGGGTTFGPRNETNYKKKINKKMARKALLVILSSKAKAQDILVIDNINFDNWKTKEMASVLKNFSGLVKGGKKLLVIGSDAGKDLKRISKNIPNLDLIEAKNLSAFDAVSRNNLLFLEGAIKELSRK